MNPPDAPLSTPRWSTLRLDRHLTALKLSLVGYLAVLVALWLQALEVVHMSNPLAVVAGATFVALYLFVIGEAFFIQKVLNDAGVYGHGAWQVIVGAVFLNPCVLGFWIPISVLVAAARVRARLPAADGPWSGETETSSPAHRPIVPAAPPTATKRLMMAALLPLLAGIVAIPLHIGLLLISAALHGVRPSETPTTVTSRALSIPIALIACFAGSALFRLGSSAARHYPVVRLAAATACGFAAGVAALLMEKRFWPATDETLSSVIFLGCLVAGGFAALGRPRRPA